MSNPTIPVIKFLFRDDYKTLSEALKLNPGFEVENFSSSNEMATFLSTIPAGLIVTSLKDKNDLVQIATFLKIGKKLAKETAIKVVVLNFSGDRTFEKAIAKLGIQDFIEPTINTKALKFKIDFWMKSLNAQAKMTSAQQKTASKVSGSNSSDGSSGPEKKTSDAPIFVEPLELEDDIWLIKQNGDCKKILGKWLIRMLGPSPYVGQWNELKAGLWRFEIKEAEKEIYVPNEGAWYFSGDQKPDFVWKENIWLISGENFNLFFKNSKEILSRINSKDRVLTVCKNSLYAKTKEPSIIESFDKELVFRKEAENLEDLEGKSNTDQLAGGNIKGKNSTPADRSGNLSGKTEFDEDITNDNLEGKSNTSKESKFWGGKSGPSEAQESTANGAKAGGLVEAPLLESKNETDHKKFYKNHNEAKQYLADEEEAKKREGFREEEGKDLAGKTETDKLSKYYDGKERSAAEKEAREKDPGLAGKTDTDHLKSHYGGKASGESAAKDAKEKPSAEKGDAPNGGKPGAMGEKDSRDPNGKSTTDKLDGRTSGKISSPDEVNPKDPSGKSTTDRIETKYGGATSANEAKKDPKDPNRSAHKDDEASGDLSGKSATEKLASHYGKPLDRKAPIVTREKKEAETYYDDSVAAQEQDGYQEEARRKGQDGNDGDGSGTDGDYGQRFGRRRDRRDISMPSPEIGSTPISERTAEILPLEKARNEAAKKATQVATNEAGLDDITADARVTCTISFQQKRIYSELNDFFDDTIVFLANDPGLSPNDAVGLGLSFRLNKSDTNLTLPGKVSGIDGDGEGGTFVTVKLSAENVAAFGKFMDLFKSRQNNVDEFLKLVKGL